MKFAEPIWLFAGLAVIAAMIWVYFYLDRKQRALLAEFASSHLLAKLTASFSPARRRLKRGLFLAALAFAFIALARPQWGYHWTEEKQRGIDILFAIDTSKSMLTQDVTPDRLTRAKMAITDLVRKLDGDRVGLVAFAGDAFLQVPLTLDYSAFEDSLDAVDTNTIPRGGTDIASAIKEAQVALDTESKHRKILVLVTDGEDLDAHGIDAAKAAASDGLVIYTVGVGTPSGGLIPVPNPNGGTDFVKDEKGDYVKSHLDENTLRQIAQSTGGMYEPLGQHGEGLQKIYDEALAPLPKADLSSKRDRIYEERYQWPLAAALGCLLASLMIGTRRGRKGTGRLVKKMPAASAAAVLALIALAPSAHASPQSAENAFKKGNYPEAEKQYQQAAESEPNAAPLQFDVGASAYKSGQFDTALPAFQKALNTDQLPVQEQAYYGIGNTKYRLGQKTEKSSPQDTIKTWQEAVQSYDAALKLKPDDADAKFNRDFVEKKLQQLQKQNPQQQKQDQKQQQNQQNQQQQNQQQQNSQQNQNQQNQKNDQNQQQQQQSNSQQNQNQQNQQNQNQQQQSGSQGQQDQQANNQQKQNQNQNEQARQDQKQSGSQQQQQSTAQNNNQQQQQQQNQQGQQGQPKDQQQDQQTAGNSGQQKPGQQQMAQNNEKPAGPRGATIPDKDQSQQAQGSAQAEAAEPGQLTKDEAKDLLNSLKDEEHILPVTADARNVGHSQDQPVLKDW